MRKRQRKAFEIEETSSISSVSSNELDDGPVKPKLGHKDVYTQGAIALDLAKYPPLDPATQGEMIRRYRMLHRRIQVEGLYQCNYEAYAVEIY